MKAHPAVFLLIAILFGLLAVFFALAGQTNLTLIEMMPVISNFMVYLNKRGL